jgi:hypothetical protein
MFLVAWPGRISNAISMSRFVAGRGGLLAQRLFELNGQ